MEEFITEVLNIYSTITPEQLKAVGIISVFYLLLLFIYTHTMNLLFNLNEKIFNKKKKGENENEKKTNNDSNEHRRLR